MKRDASGRSTSVYPLPLEGGQGGIARTSEYIVMRYISLSAFCKSGFSNNSSSMEKGSEGSKGTKGSKGP